MQSAEEFKNRVEAILGDGRVEMTWSTVFEAKTHLGTFRRMQQQLRMIKKEIGLTTKQIRGQFQSKKAHVGTGLGIAVFAGVFGRKSAGKVNTVERDTLRAKQEQAIGPYQQLSMGIDSALMQIDQMKLQIEEWIALNGKTVASAMKAVPAMQIDTQSTFCHDCGQRNKASYKHCTTCGAVLS